MRVAIAFVMAAWASTAHADKLYSPVYIKQTTAACGDIASLKIRDGLLKQNRTEMLSGMNTLSAVTGECGNAPESQWMYFDQASGDYVCLRPRLGAECAWVRKVSVGEIVELNFSAKKPDCQAMAAAIDKSRKFEDDLTARYLSERPKSRAEDFARDLMGGMLGMVTGVTNTQVDHAKSCLYNFVKGQEEARRYLSHRACPALAPGRAEKERSAYNGTLRYTDEFCTPR